nr:MULTISPECIES: cellulose biosynthesis protein BcsG [unclassified Aeromonas]
MIFPLPRAGWRRARHWLALPVGAGIFYHDTWLPGIESIRAQGSQVFSFTLDYWAELLGRFINWEMVGAGFVLLTLYLFIVQWLRFTPIGRSRRDWCTSRRACQPRRPPSMCSSSMSAPWPGMMWRRAA